MEKTMEPHRCGLKYLLAGVIAGALFMLTACAPAQSGALAETPEPTPSATVAPTAAPSPKPSPTPEPTPSPTLIPEEDLIRRMVYPFEDRDHEINIFSLTVLVIKVDGVKKNLYIRYTGNESETDIVYATEIMTNVQVLGVNEDVITPAINGKGTIEKDDFFTNVPGYVGKEVEIIDVYAFTEIANVIYKEKGINMTLPDENPELYELYFNMFELFDFPSKETFAKFVIKISDPSELVFYDDYGIGE